MAFRFLAHPVLDPSEGARGARKEGSFWGQKDPIPDMANADFEHALHHALHRVGLLGAREGSKKGAVPYSVGGTVPAYGLTHFIFAPFFDPSEGRFQRSVAHD